VSYYPLYLFLLRCGKANSFVQLLLGRYYKVWNAERRFDALVSAQAHWQQGAQPAPVRTGHEARHILTNMGLIRSFASVDGAPAILTPAQLEAMPCEWEDAMVTYLLPFLWDTLSPFPSEAQVLPWVIFSSERYRQLYHPEGEPVNEAVKPKPSVNVTVKPFFTPDALDAGDKVGGATNKTRYGDVHSGLLRYEAAKLVGVARVGSDLKFRPFDELCNYHAHIPNMCRGIVFNETEFWLYKINHGLPYGLITGIRWDQPGSAREMRDFFAEGPRGALICALEHFIVNIGGIALDEGAFLGAGATGAVFRCVSLGTSMALKVVLFHESDCDDSVFIREVQTLSDLLAKGAPIVCPKNIIIHSRAVNGLPAYGAYTMTPVGARVIATKENCLAIFTSLNEHTLGGVHGDASISQCFIVDGKDILWIGFSKGASALPFEAARDAHINRARTDVLQLCASILTQAGSQFEFTYDMVSRYNIHTVVWMK
jgi:hypothetical protein